MERKLRSFLTLSFIIISLMAVGIVMQTATAHADAVPVMTFYGKSISAPYFSKYWYQIDMGSRFKGASKVTIKSSNKKVFAPDPLDKEAFKYHCIYGEAKKKGSCTITIKVKKSSGTRTYKCKFRTVKYQNPFSSFKLGSKKLQSKFKKFHAASFVNKAKSAKIKIKAKKGWSIKKIVYERNEFVEGKTKITKKTIKNGSTIKFKPGDEYVFETIYVTMYNKKLKEKVQFVLYPSNY